MDSNAFDARQFHKWLNHTSDRDQKEAIFYVLSMNKKHAAENPERDERFIDRDLLEGNQLELADPQLHILHKVIATNDTTPPAILDWLASVDDEYVRMRVAENKNTEAETLSKLAGDPCVDVRVAVAENGNISDTAMSLLCKDECVDVRYAIAENTDTPQEILIMLEEDENPYVSHRAQQTIQKTEPLRAIKPVKVSTVLIVDDDHFIRALLKEQICSDPTFTVVGEASNGLDGLDQVLHLHPDIVLMDIGLPMLNGVASTQHIKAEMPNVKVLMVTGRDDDADIIGAIEAGADGYLLKAGSSDNLLTALHQLAANNSWIDPGVASTVLRQCVRQPNISPTSPVKRPVVAKQPINNAITVVFDMAAKATKEGRWEVARTLCQAALQIAEESKDESPNEISQLLSKLADTCYSQEDYKGSESLYLKALELRQSQLEEGDPKLDSYVTFLAKLYESAGNHQQAELYYSWSLRIREQAGDPALISEAQEKLQSVMTQHQEG